MSRATFRFYAELTDFLPCGQGEDVLIQEFGERASIKDVIEAIGVPHTEVEGITVNDEYVDFSYLVQNGDRIDVYPPSSYNGQRPEITLRPEPPAELRFVLDTHLGRLASHLRMLGFDALYRNDYEDEELANLSSSEDRVLLTRDQGLLKRKVVTYGYFVRETDPWLQLIELLGRYELFDTIRPFRRCARCNGLLRTVRKSEIDHRLLPETRRHFDEFRLCSDCDKIYWKGSHYERIEHFIERVMQARPSETREM